MSPDKAPEVGKKHTTWIAHPRGDSDFWKSKLLPGKTHHEVHPPEQRPTAPKPIAKKPVLPPVPPMID